MFTSKLIPQDISDLKKTQSPHIMLPLEVVTYIMEFLPYSDRISAGHVCQLWYEASIHPKFLKREKVVFNRMSLDDEQTYALKIIERSCRPFLHFVFIELELSAKMLKFWTKSGPEIKSLSLQSCDVSEKMFVEILSNCRSLEYLDVNDCREPFISGRLLDDRNDIDKLKKSLINVTKLGLGQNRYLSDALFNRFVSVMINLSEISLAGCQISFHPGLYKKFYPNKLVSHDTVYDSETVLTFLNIIQFIQRNSEKLHSLDFSQTLINSKSLSQIAELPELCLKELYLQSCEQLTNAGVLSVTQYQCSLLVLDLSGCSRVTDQSLIHICNRLPQLRKLRVCNCRAITDLGVVELKKLPKLEFVDLSQCEQVSGNGIKNGLCSNENKQFKHLYLRALNEITSLTVISLSENFKNLLRLDLSYCFNAVNDVSVQAIFKNLICLRSLKLANCEAITDAGLTGMQMENESAAEVCLQLEEKSCMPKHYISLRSKAEEGIVHDAKIKEAVKLMCKNYIPGQESYSLACLKGLQELDMQSCSRITDVSLEYAMKLKELQHLNLSRCQQITDAGLAFIASNNPSIDTLNLSHCHNISDNGITALSARLHRLKYIDLQGCRQLTNTSLYSIKSNCPSLRYLDISHCKMVPDAIDLSSLTALQTLHISNSLVF